MIWPRRRCPGTFFCSASSSCGASLDRPLSMDRERFVAEFIAPNMTWQRDWAQELLVHGALPASSLLPSAYKAAGPAGGGRVHLPEPARA